MDKIKVGEYVRTKEGFIAKCIEIDEDGDYFTFDHYVEVQYGDEFFSLYDNELNKILKHSENIIDLIEVGDYVNGKKIEAILDGGFKSEGVAERILCFEIDFPIEKGLRAYHNCDIKSIVTKEQFSSVEYRLEE